MKRKAGKFREARKKTDRPSASKMGLATNQNAGPTNRADSELKHMMSYKPSGMAQASRRRK